jgi:hypothetical protein
MTLDDVTFSFRAPRAREDLFFLRLLPAAFNGGKKKQLRTETRDKRIEILVGERPPY